MTKAGGERFGEAVRRLRAGEVHRTPGYDGEYGVIRLFEPGEIRASAEGLFDAPTPVAPPAKPPRQRQRPPQLPRQTEPPLAPPVSPHQPWEPMLAGMEEVGTGLLDRLDAMQRVAASASAGPLLVVAGPGTGKTRTLTHRIAYLCAELGVRPEECLAITFTRRAAEEMRHRLGALMGEDADKVTVATFHALGLQLLRENAAAAGLPDDFTVGDGEASDVEVTLDELTERPMRLLAADERLVDRYQARWPWVFVDEYQDVDATQYELLRLLVPPDGNICAIGDPDQAIYSFRGADVGYFLRFARDFKDARVVRLARNYRSTAPIIAAAFSRNSCRPSA